MVEGAVVEPGFGSGEGGGGPRAEGGDVEGFDAGFDGVWGGRGGQLVGLEWVGRRGTYIQV